MERWLCQQLADKKDVWANFTFYFPGNFFKEIVAAFRTDFPSNPDYQWFDKESLIWCFDELLRDLKDDVFRPLKNYLQQGDEGLKRYQLADQLAQLFDQYQFLRPEWLATWEQGGSLFDAFSKSPGDTTRHVSEMWQRALWQKLLDRYSSGDRRSKGAVWIDTINSLNQHRKAEILALLPERLSVFGINAMSPLYLHFLQTISEFIDVHFFLLNPTKAYWADLPRKQQLARELSRQNDSSAEIYSVDNQLLSSYGQQGRDFQQLLLEQCTFEHQFSSFETVHRGTILAHIQQDILNNTHTELLQAEAPDSMDNSISVHACHTPVREVQVVKDQLLAALQSDENLSLRDIIVMAPDISRYAPFIDAVFDDIPHAIADKTTLDSNSPLQIFIRFLELSQGRWEVDAVLAVLEEACVYRKFGLLETDFEHLHNWVEQTRIRWGESAEHRQELGLPCVDENSWQAGLERLLMGYTNASENEFSDDILPFTDIEGSQAQALGGLYQFIRLLIHYKSLFGQSHTLKYWGIHLQECVSQLLSDTDNEATISAIYQLIEELQKKQIFHQQKVSLAVIVNWLNSAASSRRSSAGFLRGQLTFCSMLPMRAIPFKVIALLGMNEGEFPHQEVHSAFDLMSRDFRKGDKSSRMDERYQFLEILLSARKQIILCYQGSTQHRNNQPPSIVVSELLDVLSENYQLDLSDIHIKQPLQPFSQRYFSDQKHYFSYSAQHFRICQSVLNSHPPAATPWWQGEVSVETPEVIHINDLLSFYQHPQRYFLQHQVALQIPSLNIKDVESEPFEIPTLSQYQIDQQWVAELMNAEGESFGFLEDQYLQRLRAEGRWLSGHHANVLFDAKRDEIHSFVEQLKRTPCGKPMDALAVDLDIGSYRLVGSIQPRYENGNLFYRYAKLKGKDLLSAWICHLVTLQYQAATTWLCTQDTNWRFQEVADSQQHLLVLIEQFVSGLRSPSPFILDAALVLQRTLHNKTSRSDPLEAALSQYKGELDYDEYLQTIYQGMSADSVLNKSFVTTSKQILTSIWDAGCQDCF